MTIVSDKVQIQEIARTKGGRFTADDGKKLVDEQKQNHEALDHRVDVLEENVQTLKLEHRVDKGNMITRHSNIKNQMQKDRLDAAYRLKSIELEVFGVANTVRREQPSKNDVDPKIPDRKRVIDGIKVY